MRATLAARICSSLIVWAIDEVVKTTAAADTLRNDDIERIGDFMVFVFTSRSVAAFILCPWAEPQKFSNHVAINDTVAAGLVNCEQLGSRDMRLFSPVGRRPVVELVLNDSRSPLCF